MSEKKTWRAVASLCVSILWGLQDPGRAQEPPSSPGSAPGAVAAEGGPALVIHGGAGTLRRDEIGEEKQAEIYAKLREALLAGFSMLKDGASALDAVESTIRILEDSPLFNAGKGAVFTAEGKNELDASIMNGATLDSGAVAGVTRVKNPISAARAVMEQTPHVMLSGPGADRFVEKIGLEQVEPSYYFTRERWEALEKARAKESGQAATASERAEKLGTVGAVALDRHGHIAAGTSTGGMTNKRHGRVGDSPVVGAGTYANASCGVSSTGHGEYFIRHVVAHDICRRMEYRKLLLEEAAESVIHGSLKEAGGSGGIIALSSDAELVLEFNTEGMYRGWIAADGVPHVAIYRDDPQ